MTLAMRGAVLSLLVLSLQALWLVPTRAGAGAVSASCDQVLATACDAARRQGLFACGNCVGTNSQKLKDAGCNDTYAGQFCNNQTCVMDICSEEGLYRLNVVGLVEKGQ